MWTARSRGSLQTSWCCSCESLPLLVLRDFQPKRFRMPRWNSASLIVSTVVPLATIWNLSIKSRFLFLVRLAQTRTASQLEIMDVLIIFCDCLSFVRLCSQDGCCASVGRTTPAKLWSRILLSKVQVLKQFCPVCMKATFPIESSGAPSSEMKFCALWFGVLPHSVK